MIDCISIWPQMGYIRDSEARFNQGTNMLSGQIAHEKWCELLSDQTVASGIMDRLVQISYIIEFNSIIYDICSC